MNNKIIFKEDIYYYDVIRENIRKYRKILNINQGELAKLTNFSLKYISDIENKKKHNQFTIPTFLKIGDALGIQIDDLFVFNVDFNSLRREIKDNNYYYNKVRKNVRKYRLSKEFTQEQLSILIDVSREFISQIETTNKTFSLATIGRISDALDISIEKFFKN